MADAKHSAHTVRDVPLFDGRGIDHVGIRYHDLKKALGWFRDTLGLPVDHETGTMAFVRVGDDGSHLALFQAEGASRHGSHTMSRCGFPILLQPRRHCAPSVFRSAASGPIGGSRTRRGTSSTSCRRASGPRRRSIGDPHPRPASTRLLRRARVVTTFDGAW